MASSAPLEALQGLTPDRVPNLPTALSAAAGALLAALLAKLVMEARKGRALANNQAGKPEPRVLAQPEEIWCILEPWTCSRVGAPCL
jgi:hypothetical protein